MSTVKEILDYTLGLAPQDWKEDWDNVGLLCGHADQDVRRCLVALDVTMAVAQEAFNRGAELIVSHHPLLFSTQSLSDADPAGRLLLYLAEHRIAVISLHTNLDSAPGGVNDVLAGRLGLTEIRTFTGETHGIGRVGLVEEQPLPAFAALVKERLGCRTVLGVSNVSFGLPARPIVNATFLAAAFSAGLDLPILNPLAERYREVVDTWRVLCGQDAGSAGYIAGYAGRAVPTTADAAAAKAGAAPADAADAAADDGKSELYRLVVAGNKGPVPAAVEALLVQVDAMEVINGHLIPALDDVGERVEKGAFCLPQLRASAEAAKAGFDVIRTHAGGSDEGKGPIAIATVKGDIHDIGKNIVRMLLENYGYKVFDLGRDVDPQAVVDAALEHDCKIVGLSALMTTTVKAMEETIKLLRAQAPGVKVMVGGAVLTQEYADMIGADFYAKDAAESARYSAQVIQS